MRGASASNEQLAAPPAVTGVVHRTSLVVVSVNVAVAVLRSPRLPSAASATVAVSGTLTTSLPDDGAPAVVGPV